MRVKERGMEDIMNKKMRTQKFQLKNDWADAERPQLCARSSNVDMAT